MTVSRQRVCVILSGQVLSDAGLLPWLAGRALLVCADGGARHLFRLNILPDLLVGDLDSIGPEEQAWLAAAGIPVRQFPPAKDMTDSELAITIAIELAANLAREQTGTNNPAAFELVVLAAFGSRPDHVLANQLLAARLAASGCRVVLTDGLSHLAVLHGPDRLAIPSAEFPWPGGASGKDGNGSPEPDHETGRQSGDVFQDNGKYQASRAGPFASKPHSWAFSAIPVTAEVTGLTYSGLQYPLDHATLAFGTTRGVSNELARDQQLPALTVEITSGTLMVILTPAH